MKTTGKNGHEFWVVIALLAIFLAVAFYSEQAGQSVVSRVSSSTLNTRPEGSKALYALFSTLPYPVRRLTTPWFDLNAQDGLLIVIEKLDESRPITAQEIAGLRKWTEGGGTVLYFVQEPARPLDPKDTVAGDVAILDALEDETQAAPASEGTSYTRQVGAILVASRVRLKPAPAAPYKTLFADKQGAIAIHKMLGKGHVLVVANTRMVSNQGIGQADNIVFLANVAQTAIGASGKAIAFDEYHHGVGFDGERETGQTWISTLPLPLKMAAWPFCALILLLIYNGNQRFGAARAPCPRPCIFPARIMCIRSPRWYQRAGAADLAIQTLYHDFRRDLSALLELPPDALPSETLAECARSRFPQEAENVIQIITACEQIAAAQRATSADLLSLSRGMEQCKRRLLSCRKMTTRSRT